VHAAEGVDIVLATHLMRAEAQALRQVDNQAIILGCRRYRHGRGQWAVGVFREKIAELQQTTNTTLTVRWTPGHIEIDENQEADELAKAAADGPENSSPHDILPSELHEPTSRSAAAIVQTFNKQTKARALKRWK
jgi:hypothetical protein